MGLSDGYGLVIGAKSNYFRDDPDNFGRYYHGNLEITAASTKYQCAIDVDPKAMPDGVQWRTVHISPNDFAGIRSLSDGWHNLASTNVSGALDYIRSPMLNPLPWIIRWEFVERLFRLMLRRRLIWIVRPTWKSGKGIDALTALEQVIDHGKRFYVFGEPFISGGFGVHNIHQNQGDPVGGGHDAENGVWQDGGTIVEKEDGSLVAFLNKFKTQASATDDQGRPV